MNVSRGLACLGLSLLLSAATATGRAQTPAPRLVEEHGRHALLVDGAPYLVLGAQVGNSAAWPAVLPEVWPALEAMHVNTGEAPVYWEQIEPAPGKFDWTSVDALLDGGRAHHLHLILLWFGTWKNGNDHYVPAWIKNDPAHYPRMINRYGTPLDDLSANFPANLEADRAAFTALMHHLAERDATEHTVLMMQVENESGGIGSVRDYSPEANRQFAGPVPPELLRAMGKKPGSWAEVFSGDADEVFQAWTQARYINAIAEAGKREFAIPLYCNVWLAYPPQALPERDLPTPGIGYPSGGAVQRMLPLWKAAAPAIDAIGPDIYASSPVFYTDILDTYARPDNPLWVPETGQGDDYAPYFFSALGHGAIGFSPFGIDWAGSLPPGTIPRAHAANYALIGSMERTVARLNYGGQLRTLVEATGGADQELLFPSGSASREGALLGNPLLLANATVPLDEAGTPATRAADAAGDWVAEARFGFPQRDGAPAPGSPHHDGRMLIAQLGPNQYLVTGMGGAVFFHRPGFLPGIRMQILEAEEGYYTPASTPGAPEVWNRTRLLNGDQTDRGIQFPDPLARTGNGSDGASAGNQPPAATETRERKPLAVRITLSRF